MKSIRLVILGLVALLVAGALGGCKGSGDSDVKSPYDFEKYDPVVELTTDRYITSEDGLSAWGGRSLYPLGRGQPRHPLETQIRRRQQAGA